MSKADKMFEELGYEKTEDGNLINYASTIGEIIFQKKHKEYWHEDESCILPKEHLAIHEKMKELGWIK